MNDGGRSDAHLDQLFRSSQLPPERADARRYLLLRSWHRITVVIHDTGWVETRCGRTVEIEGRAYAAELPPRAVVCGQCRRWE